VKIGLRIEVSTVRALKRGVPHLIETLKALGAGATFLFALGPDRSGWLARRMLCTRIDGRWRPFRALRRYGLGTLLAGPVLPARDLAGDYADLMRAVQREGFEVGLLAHDHIAWRKRAARADAQWTREALELARERFAAVFGEPPRVSGAAGWQVNRYSLRLTQRLGLDYASDTRGSGPFIPVWQAEIVACPQLPVTLPTLEELNAELPLEAAAERLVELTAQPPATGHVYAARADLEGVSLAPAFEKLLQRWRGQGYEILSLKRYAEGLPAGDLPRHEVAREEVARRFGPVAVQGREFLA
jgi:peptidoglycan/xylan/chitin deacetylase (PgdA/CDA1 family)